MRLAEPLSVGMRRALNKFLSPCLPGGPGSVCDGMYALLSNMAECEFFENSKRKSLDLFGLWACSFFGPSRRLSTRPFSGEADKNPIASCLWRVAGIISRSISWKRRAKEKDKGFLLKNVRLLLRSYSHANTTFHETADEVFLSTSSCVISP